MKNSLLLLILLAVCCNATDEWKFDYETKDKVPTNFTIGQRIATGTLNIIPGLGSMVIMDDFWGAVPQWALGAGAITSFVLAVINEQEHSRKRDEYYDCRSSGGWDKCGDYPQEDGFYIYVFTGLGFLGTSFIYNIYRSITYDKPKQTAFGENSGFNLAVLPNRNGKLNAFLMFNKAF